MLADVYQRLANHLSTLSSGYPIRDDLLDILRLLFTPKQAEVVLALPTKVVPFQLATTDEILSKVNLPREELVAVLEELTRRLLVFSGETSRGQKGYALHQVGHGFPQVFFWKGEETPQARTMAGLVANYFNRQVTREAYAGSESKPYRYIPINQSIGRDIQAVYPYDSMAQVIEKAEVIVVAHCPCRVSAGLVGKGCDHPLEVCLHFDALAEYMIEKGLARQVTKTEAMQIIAKSEEANLVHFVDNAFGNIKHNCNCCGCCCWSVGTIRRRKIPRDMLMATYFIRETDVELCNGCGDCVGVCPVNAVTMQNDTAIVDKDWCIGCGVCIRYCTTSAIRLEARSDVLPSATFEQLHERILAEKGFR